MHERSMDAAFGADCDCSHERGASRVLINGICLVTSSGIPEDQCLHSLFDLDGDFGMSGRIPRDSFPIGEGRHGPERSICKERAFRVGPVNV